LAQKQQQDLLQIQRTRFIKGDYMGLLDFLLPGVGTVIGGVAGAIGGHLQKGREEEAQKRAMQINRYAPLTGVTMQEKVPQTSTLGSALGGAFQGAQAGLGLSKLTDDKEFIKKGQGAILKALERGDMNAANNIDAYFGGGMKGRLTGEAFGVPQDDIYGRISNQVYGGY
jgi:hypothetical protein